MTGINSPLDPLHEVFGNAAVFSARAKKIEREIFSLLETPASDRSTLNRLRRLVRAWYTPAVQNSLERSGRGNRPCDGRDDAGYSFQTKAAEKGTLLHLAYLFRAGASANGEDANGWLPSTMIASRGHDHLVPVLRRAHVDFEKIDGQSWLPSTVAVACGKGKFLIALDAVGVNFYKPDGYGLSAFERARGSVKTMIQKLQPSPPGYDQATAVLDATENAFFMD